MDEFEQVSGRRDLDHTEDALGKLVVASGDSSVELEMADYVLKAFE